LTVVSKFKNHDTISYGVDSGNVASK